TGTVAFTICDPDVLAANSETTCDTGGTPVGIAATLNPTSGASPPSSTTDSTTFVTANKIGTWCWRAVYTPATGSFYTGSSDHSSGECFTVSKIDTMTTTHPQEAGSNITTASFGDHVTDHAQVDAANALDGDVNGTVSFTICDPDDLAAANGGAGE